MTDHDQDLAQLLATSLQFHEQARALRKAKKVTEAKVALSEAARLRREAHESNPDHLAPAWAEEQKHSPRGRDTHTDMRAFYIEQGVW